MTVNQEKLNIHLILKCTKLHISLQNMNFMKSVVIIVIWLNLSLTQEYIKHDSIYQARGQLFLFIRYFVVASQAMRW